MKELLHEVLINHILAMKDDAYLTGHPEWQEIVNEAEDCKKMQDMQNARVAIIPADAVVKFEDE